VAAAATQTLSHFSGCCRQMQTSEFSQKSVKFLPQMNPPSHAESIHHAPWPIPHCIVLQPEFKINSIIAHLLKMKFRNGIYISAAVSVFG
jgi:hypothetical protein